jgi:hypothetical protein
VLPRLFNYSLGGRYCQWHAVLVEHATANDVFISFNYDCILDRALKSAKRKWIPARGYGFPINSGTEHWQDHGGKGPLPNPGIRLLKPHGSLNWTRNGNTVALRSDPYAPRPDGELLIVPPLWQKEFAEEPFQTIWSTARRVLSAVKALFVIGYSLPETDVYTQALLRLDVGPLDFLCIVNPDLQARDRVKAVLRSSIESTTHIVELATFDEFVQPLLV